MNRTVSDMEEVHNGLRDIAERYANNVVTVGFVKKLAEKFGVHQITVRREFADYGITFKALSKLDESAIALGYHDLDDYFSKAGIKYIKDMAAELGVAYQTLSRYFRDYNERVVKRDIIKKKIAKF